MLPFEQLRKVAQQRRDALVKQARNEYRNTVRELKAITKRVEAAIPKKPRVESGNDFSALSPIDAAEVVLRPSYRANTLRFLH